MKTSATHLLALAALVLAPTPAVGHEAMLGDDESTGTRRRLNFFKKDPTYYQSIYYRCCNTGGSEGDDSLTNEAWRFPLNEIPTELGIKDTDYCKCPKRGSGSRSWFSWGKKETYFDKWERSCGPGGSIRKKAGINGNGGD